MHLPHSNFLEFLSTLSVAARTVSCRGRVCLYSVVSVALLLAQSGALAVSAQETIVDTLDRTVYFRMGYRYVEPSYKNNREALDNIISYVEENKEVIEAIEIIAWTSPDGKILANNRLSAARADSLAAYMIRNSSLSPEHVRVVPGGIAWKALRDMVAETSLDYRDDVVKIIDNIPLYVFDRYGKIIGGRKKVLMDHQGGANLEGYDGTLLPGSPFRPWCCCS